MKKTLVIILFFLIPFVANSATDGILGNTSTGTINIAITLNTVVQVSQTKDVILSYTPGINSGDLEYVVDLCIYTNHPSGTYKMIETSNFADGTTNKVLSTSSSTIKIPYEAHWFTNSTATGAPAHIFSSGVVSPNFNGAHTTSNTCLNGTQNTASLKLVFKEADLIAIGSGNYTDIVTIVVSPI